MGGVDGFDENLDSTRMKWWFPQQYEMVVPSTITTLHTVNSVETYISANIEGLVKNVHHVEYLQQKGYYQKFVSLKMLLIINKKMGAFS